MPCTPNHSSFHSSGSGRARAPPLSCESKRRDEWYMADPPLRLRRRARSRQFLFLEKTEIGGGGGIRTRVPKHQIKNFYMFILPIYLPAGTSTGGISDGQPFKISSHPKKAIQGQTILLATSFRPHRMSLKTGCSI